MEDQQIKWEIEALKEIRTALKTCRAEQIETLDKIHEILKLLLRLTEDRKTGEGQESKTTGVEPVELGVDLKELKKMRAEGISLFWTRFNSQADFEYELLKKMRATIFKLADDLLEMEKFEEWPLADRIRFCEFKDKIMMESQNFMLNLYNSIPEQMKDHNFWEKRAEALKDERKRREEDRRRSSELGSVLRKEMEEKK